MGGRDGREGCVKGKEEKARGEQKEEWKEEPVALEPTVLSVTVCPTGHVTLPCA